MDRTFSKECTFIAKLNGILDANYHNENFGVTELSLAMGVSRSQLHRKLHQIKNTSTSEFIKLFRLEKAYNLLKDDVSSVSEIAYAVGFSSPSYFSKCFQDHYKCSPGKAKQKEVSEKLELLVHASVSSKSKTSIGKWTLIGAVLALVILALFTITLAGSTSKNQDLVTIGVLPFKNLTEDVSNQYFADGIMEEILNHLSSLDNLNVLSRTTMENYPRETKTVPELAKGLNITHLLEASVQRHGKRVRIVIQLIDANLDKHLWAESYERDYQDVFELQSDIAREVAKQLERKLTVSNLAKLDEAPAENVEAYNLYLKGRFFWQRRKEEDLKKSIRYFEQAIDLEPNYALAYAGLADAYYIMAVFGWYDKEESFRKGKEYAMKALSIDDNIAAAHATLGATAFWYEWNWVYAEKEIKKAIDLAPNYATAHLYYAILLDILGRKEEAREQIDLAVKFNPNSGIMFNISGIIFYNSRDFTKSLNHLNKSVEISDEPWYAYYFKNFMRLGEESLAYKQLKLILARNGIKDEAKIDRVFEEDGIKGVLNCCIDDLSFSVKDQYYNSAAFLCLVGYYQKALDYLERSYEARETHLPRIKHSIDFEAIRNDPRFTALLHKMNF
ncbi:helix-turn-helix domain-containing protein [Aestuariivivens marinum]|uniref:helix-turn-helix domain-containing protein n=1 Tax=Aestuariivivens marinum TaxID=2913555 RepID=UPI001F5959D8|nr:helix-turn-helix domain-containing protein [Aestuariivivens marinum]